MSQHHGIKDETADKVFQAPHDSVFSRRDVPVLTLGFLTSKTLESLYNTVKERKTNTKRTKSTTGPL